MSDFVETVLGGLFNLAWSMFIVTSVVWPLTLAVTSALRTERVPVEALYMFDKVQMLLLLYLLALGGAAWRGARGLVD